MNTPTTTTETSTINDSELRAFIERIERLEEEKSTISDDIKEVYQELKGSGYVPKIIRTIVRKRKKDKATIMEEEALIDLYETALGIMKY